jgi:hypothetical protein
MPVFDTSHISRRRHVIVIVTCFLGRLNLILAIEPWVTLQARQTHEEPYTLQEKLRTTERQ